MTPSGSSDLHVHTTHSDGSCSPGEVVRAAASLNLSALAITDHDTLSAYSIAKPEADRLGLELIPGVELSCDFEDREIHILGHFLDPTDPALVKSCLRLRTERAERMQVMTDHLRGFGLQIDLPALRRLFPRAALGRRHLADWLVKSGQVPSRKEVFELYLSDHALAHVPKPRIIVDTAINMLLEAGGTAALAHPPRNLRQTTLARLVEMGLNALEVNGPGISRSHQVRFESWATHFNLVPIAGSDFHAPDRPGAYVGSITTTSKSLERLRLAAPCAT